MHLLASHRLQNEDFLNTFITWTTSIQKYFMAHHFSSQLW